MNAGLAGKCLAALIIVGALVWCGYSIATDVLAWLISRVRNPESAQALNEVLSRVPVPEYPPVIGDDEEMIA